MVFLEHEHKRYGKPKQTLNQNQEQAGAPCNPPAWKEVP